MDKPENPQAFPLDHWQRGMTLRDYFAGQALAGFAASHHATPATWVEDRVARSCYEAANAMLAVRRD